MKANTDTPRETLLSEPIQPAPESPILVAPTVGEPLLPSRFRRGKLIITFTALLEKWKESGPCQSGSGERYVRRHGYRLRDSDGAIYRVYFERQAGGRSRRARWRIYSRENPDE